MMPSSSARPLPQAAQSPSSSRRLWRGGLDRPARRVATVGARLGAPLGALLGAPLGALLGALALAACNSGGTIGSLDGGSRDRTTGTDTRPPEDRPTGDLPTGVDQPAGQDRTMSDVAVGPDLPVMTPDKPGPGDVTFTISSQERVHPISPYIYGHNAPDWSANPTMARVGGNRLTAYNWENNASNAGSDYQFQNDNFLCQDQGCDQPGEAMRRAVQDAQDHGASIIMTVPIAGHVAADEGPGGDVRNSGSNYLSTRFKALQPAKGAAFSLMPDMTDGNVYADEFVNWLNTTFPAAHADPVKTIFYMLDNEPDLWSSTHAEIHPDPVTYAELVQRNTDYASAIKNVVPDALTFGFVSYGFAGYENLQNAPDAQGRNFIEFYLDQMKAAEQSAGKRLVDVLDLHWYPEATSSDGRRITAADADDDIANARMQAPRSLWDPGYKENSWITNSYLNAPIQLIPYLQGKIDAHYPGTKLSFSEYNYGGGGDISGGVAQADVLGILGREGIFAAAVWQLNGDESYIQGAIKMYRNYDGQAGHFGDTSIAADTDKPDLSSVYASVDAGHPERMVLVLINKDSAAKTAALQITHTVLFKTAKVYLLAAGSPNPVPGADVSLVARNAFNYAMPPRSVITLVLSP